MNEQTDQGSDPVMPRSRGPGEVSIKPDLMAKLEEIFDKFGIDPQLLLDRVLLHHVVDNDEFSDYVKHSAIPIRKGEGKERARMI